MRNEINCNFNCIIHFGSIHRNNSSKSIRLCSVDAHWSLDSIDIAEEWSEGHISSVIKHIPAASRWSVKKLSCTHGMTHKPLLYPIPGDEIYGRCSLHTVHITSIRSTCRTENGASQKDLSASQSIINLFEVASVHTVFADDEIASR